MFAGAGRVEWRELPLPVIQGPREAIVRPLVVGRCDLDVAYVQGLMPLPLGATLGHEIIGEVTEIGSAVQHHRPGERVFVPAQISCGECASCRRGLTGRCWAVPFAASYGMGREGDFGGGLADLVRVPFADAMLSPTPPGAHRKSLIGLADMATDGWRAVGPLLSQYPGAKVLVLAGLPAVIGLYAAGLARARSASEVHYLDSDRRRCNVAGRYGAVVIEASAHEAYDIVVVADPRKSALEAGFAAAAPGGSITSVTPTLDGGPQLNTAVLYQRGVTWRIGRPDCRHGHDGALAAWANCGFCPDVVPTRYVAWDEAPEAWSSDALYVAAVRE